MENETQTTSITAEQTDQAAQTENTTPALFDESKFEQDTRQQEEQQQEKQDTEETNKEIQSIKPEDIKIPEGYEYDKELGESFLGILNDEKISRKELGQKLFDLYQAQNVKLLEGLKAAETEKIKKFDEDIKAEKEAWLKQCQADKEFGGQNWEASQAVIDRGCKLLATPEAVNLMQAYNLNTHPEIVRMFYRAGKLAGEDNSRISGNFSKTNEDPAMAIFGKDIQKYYEEKGKM